MPLIDSRHRGAWLVALVAFATSAGAQRAPRVRLSPTEVAQIADEALRVVVPPELELSGVTVAERQIAFDVVGTLSAFGVAAVADTGFHLHRAVTIASRDVLSDCSQAAPEPCAHLGRRAHVLVSPTSISRTHATVRVTVGWAARSGSVPDTVATGKGFLEGFGAKLYFARRTDGVWRFVKQDRTVIAF